MDTLKEALTVAGMGIAIGGLSSLIMHLKNPYGYHMYDDFDRRVGVPGILGSFSGILYQLRHVFSENLPASGLEFSKNVIPDMAIMTGTAIGSFELLRYLVHQGQVHFRRLSKEDWKKLDKRYYDALETAQDSNSHRFTVINMANELQARVDNLIQEKQLHEITDSLFEFREKVDSGIKGTYVNKTVFEILGQQYEPAAKPGDIKINILGRPAASRRTRLLWRDVDSIVEEELAGAFVLWEGMEVEYFEISTEFTPQGPLTRHGSFRTGAELPYVPEKQELFDDETTVPCFERPLLICSVQRPRPDTDDYKKYVREYIMRTFNQYLRNPKERLPPTMTLPDLLH